MYKHSYEEKTKANYVVKEGTVLEMSAFETDDKVDKIDYIIFIKDGLQKIHIISTIETFKRRFRTAKRSSQFYLPMSVWCMATM